jgi:DNA-binding MarR family transcriptional regulator
MTDNSPGEMDALRQDADHLRDVMLRISNLSRRQLAHILHAFALTTPQYFALMAITRHPDGCNMSALAEATHQVSATMTGIVDRLGERGLVERRPDPADRRSRRVFLTDRGRELLAAIDTTREAHSLAVIRQFTPDDRRTLIRLMTDYWHAIDSITDAAGPEKA